MPIEPSIDLSSLLYWAICITAIYVSLLAYNEIKKIIISDIFPLFYKIDQKRYRNRRRQFADHLESRIRQLNALEDWNDNRFSELEAEVEAEGRWKAFSWIPFVERSRYTIRRVRSLTTALHKSNERLILLEGEPGSGKSVALRHVAKKLAHYAAHKNDINTVMPLYINLREIDRSKNKKIDRNLIEEFIISSVTRVNDRDVESFFADEFIRGLEKGTWIFLFDSFDEIPDILSSTEADETIKMYSNAIFDFLHGMNKCRGIVASRYFRGPEISNFRIFSILPLSDEKKIKLIKRVTSNESSEQEILGRLSSAPYEIQQMTRNPMFLSLLCQYIEETGIFPESSHSVFESYIDNRIKRDLLRLQKRFNINQDDIRVAAEKYHL